MVEFQQQVRGGHPFDRIMGGYGHVVTGATQAQLGELLLAVGEVVGAHPNAGFSREVGEGGLALVVVPVVEVEAVLLGKSQYR